MTLVVMKRVSASVYPLYADSMLSLSLIRHKLCLETFEGSDPGERAAQYRPTVTQPPQFPPAAADYLIEASSPLAKVIRYVHVETYT